MCCHTVTPRGLNRWGQPQGCLCGCDEPIDFRPRFMTKAQQIASLNEYLESLRAETQAVEEQISQIKKQK